MQKPIFLDCDPGHDDAIAILLALASPELDLQAISVVAGNAPFEMTLNNACRVLELVGRNDIPVVPGHRKPLVRPLTLGTADGPSGLEGSPYLPEPTTEVVNEHAVDYLARNILNHPGQVTLVATGPLTNIGSLFLKYPDVKRNLERLILMGGSFLRPNRYHTITEFNIYCDPEAASIVFRSGVPITAVGLDVTMKVLVEDKELAMIKGIDTPLSRVVVDWLAYYEKLHRSTMGVGGALHDPLAVAVAIDPNIVTTKPAYVEIEQFGRRTFGYTAADFWQEWASPNCQVAVGVDGEKFWDLLVERLALLKTVSSY